MQLAESTNLTLFSDLLSPSSGNNNKTAAERRQMFLIGSLLAREGEQGGRGQRVVLGSRLLQSSFDAQMLVKMIFCIFFKGCRKSQSCRRSLPSCSCRLLQTGSGCVCPYPCCLHSSLHLQVRHLLRLQSSCPSDFEWHRLTTLGWQDSHGYSGAATSPGYGCRHATLNEGVGSSRQLIAYAGGVAVEGRHLKLIGSLKFLVAAVASGN